METNLKNKFLELWQGFFGDAELPIVFYYTEGDGGAEKQEKQKGWSCLIGQLSKVRMGKPLYFNTDSLGCGGAQRYLGYADTMRPDFEYFLSCGNEQMEGERYKRTPEIVKELMKNQRQLPVNGKNIVLKRWDKLIETDNPEVVIFFARPDVLSGLFTLANYDHAEHNQVIAPFGAGCGSIVHYPYLESLSENPKAVIGMFDPSARPYVTSDILTFAVPMKKFKKMIGYMEESFLITKTWDTLKKRMDKAPGPNVH